MAHIWPPLPWTTLPSITAQVPEERLWLLLFSGPLLLPFFGFKTSTNWQNRIISAWHRAWQPDNTSKARSTFPRPRIHRHAKFQDGNLFLLQFYDISTAWLSHFMAICIIAGLWQMKQTAIKCWENPKSWLCLACLNYDAGVELRWLGSFCYKQPRRL